MRTLDRSLMKYKILSGGNYPCTQRRYEIFHITIAYQSVSIWGHDTYIAPPPHNTVRFIYTGLIYVRSAIFSGCVGFINQGWFRTLIAQP